MAPPLTTVHQSRRRIGIESARILLENIENGDKEKIEKLVFEPYAVIRNSVKKLIS